MKTEWTDTRLRSLFDHYNRTYWRGKLPGYRVVRAGLSEKHAIGYCYRREKRIEIDTDQHTSDCELRATLLHEMAHAATRERGHSVGFFAQMERLIRLGAPVSVNSPEAGQARILFDVVPKRFPMLRAKMQRIGHRRSSAVLKMARETGSTITTITEDMIVMEFKDAALELTWKQALAFLGLQYGLTDEIGRPVNARANRVLRKARKEFSRARRDHLDYQKHWAGGTYVANPQKNRDVHKTCTIDQFQQKGLPILVSEALSF